jgi:hypothetical protein
MGGVLICRGRNSQRVFIDEWNNLNLLKLSVRSVFEEVGFVIGKAIPPPAFLYFSLY